MTAWNSDSQPPSSDLLFVCLFALFLWSGEQCGCCLRSHWWKLSVAEGSVVWGAPLKTHLPLTETGGDVWAVINREPTQRGGGAHAWQNKPFIIWLVSLETPKEEQKLKHIFPTLWWSSHKKYRLMLWFSSCLPTDDVQTMNNILIYLQWIPLAVLRCAHIRVWHIHSKKRASKECRILQEGLDRRRQLVRDARHLERARQGVLVSRADPFPASGGFSELDSAVGTPAVGVRRGQPCSLCGRVSLAPDGALRWPNSHSSPIRLASPSPCEIKWPMMCTTH